VAGLQPQYRRGEAGGNAVALFKAANGTRGSAFLTPDLVVLNPANWQSTRLLTDSSGQFLAGGPWYGPYGGPRFGLREGHRFELRLPRSL
jgi:hypothetical protein